MNLIEYQKLARRTRPDLGNLNINVLHMDLGIATEIGEMLDIFKRKLAYNKEIDTVNLGEEIADIAWYTVNKMDISSITPSVMLKTYTGRISMQNMYHHIKAYYKSEYPTKEAYLLDLIYNIAISYGLDFSKLLENNINKLKVRYPEKFDSNKALNRDLDSERAELEK